MKIQTARNAGLFAVCTLVLSLTTAFAQDTKLHRDLSRAFTAYELTSPNASVRPTGDVETVRLRAAGRDIELVVWRNDIYAAGYRAENSAGFGTVPVEQPRAKTYQGRIGGEAGSEVRLTIDEGTIEGFFGLERERYFVEPASRYSDSASAGQLVVYKEADVIGEKSFYCAAGLPQQIEAGQAMVAENEPQSAILASRNLEIATDADAQYVSILGGATQANANIASILNMVEGTYVAELDLEITITYQHTWTGTDPFGGSTSGDVLMAFMNHWNANFPRSTYPRDTAHLFSGKTYVQSAGVAFVGSVCLSPSFSYGVTGYVSWAPGKYLIPAHELGHNLGGDHAETAQGCGNTIMNAFLSGSAQMTFCPFSRNEISTFIAQNSSCLLNGTGGNPTPTPTPTPASTPTPTPTPNPTPTPVPTPVPTPTPTPVPSPSPTPTPNPSLRTRFDFDGDRRADLTVFRPSNGTWYMNRSSAGFFQQTFGITGDKPVPADYDGDAITDIAVFRQGTWYRINSATVTFQIISFGVAGDIPAPADFDGDQKTDLAVFRPATGVWYTTLANGGGYFVRQFGVAGDVPMPADYDADRLADIAVWRPSNGTWYRLLPGGGYLEIQFGVTGDVPVSGDFGGDGRADLAVWRPANGNWYVMSATSYTYTTFGIPGDIPSPADFDGDGITDISVFRPSNGTWYRLNSRDRGFVWIQYGVNGDSPAPSYYIQ